jgi:type VI secretion system ImpB/VipA family protein
MSDSGQKYIARNRAPRVQIEYDLETGGAQKKINLPFVMAVMSDLKGYTDADNKMPRLNEREFEDINSATFDSYLKAMRPRVRFTVADKLGGADKDLLVDIEFESLKDFTPGQIAKKVGPLRDMLDARNKLKNLLSYMDGKPDAQARVQELLSSETLLQSLANSSAAADDDAKGDNKEG